MCSLLNCEYSCQSSSCIISFSSLLTICRLRLCFCYVMVMNAFFVPLTQNNDVTFWRQLTQITKRQCDPWLMSLSLQSKCIICYVPPDHSSVVQRRKVIRMWAALNLTPEPRWVRFTYVLGHCNESGMSPVQKLAPGTHFFVLQHSCKSKITQSFHIILSRSKHRKGSKEC